MIARIYTPDDTGSCMVCGRPEGEHSRSSGWDGDPALCMPDPACVRIPRHLDPTLCDHGLVAASCHHCRRDASTRRQIAVRNVRMTQSQESPNPPKINWYNARIAAVKILACCEDAAFCSPAVFDESKGIRLNEIAAALHIAPGGVS